MKIKISVLILFTSLLVINMGFAKSAADRSGIVIEYKNFGWTGMNAGWQEDESLISPSHTLDYNLHETNRNLYPASPAQYVVSPEFEENWGEMVTNQFTSNDNVMSWTRADGSKADASELWLTWDTNWVYGAYKTEMWHDQDNIMVMFDRIPGVGVLDFSGADPNIGNDLFFGPSNPLWAKGIYLRDFETDLYIAAWYYSENKQMGSAQLCAITNLSDPKFYQLGSISDDATRVKGNTNIYRAFYNYNYEFDTLQRVFLFKIKMSTFTNWMPTVSSVTLKVVALNVDASGGSKGAVYDFVPNNLAGMNADRKTVEDNFFLIPFTDSSGNILTNIRPRYDGKIMFLPGSRTYEAPTISLVEKVSNIGTSAVFSRKLFVPGSSEYMQLGVTIPQNSNVFDGEIIIYNLRGDVIRTLKASNDGPNAGAWLAGATASATFTYDWDGLDDLGYQARMGTYIVVFSGMTEDGLAWHETTYVSLIR